jgi:hypothetical protein
MGWGILMTGVDLNLESQKSLRAKSQVKWLAIRRAVLDQNTAQAAGTSLFILLTLKNKVAIEIHEMTASFD